MKKMASKLFLWIIMLASIFICDVCIPQEVYDMVRDTTKSNRFNGRNNYEYSCTGNSYEAIAIPLLANREIMQVVMLDEAMLEDDELVVGLLFGTYSRENRGRFCVELSQGDERWDYQYPMEELADMEMYHMTFPVEGIQAGELQITLRSDDGVENNCIAIMLVQNTGINDRNKNDINNFRHMEESTVFKKVIVDGVEQQGMLLMELYTR